MKEKTENPEFQRVHVDLPRDMHAWGKRHIAKKKESWSHLIITLIERLRRETEDGR